ncbi:hypothetical protein Tco_1385713 [Tanacetum coccineum]
MILGKPFVKESKLIYDKEEETVMFEKNDEKVTSKMPHKMERFKDIEDLNIDNIPPFFVTSKGDEEKEEGYVSRKRMTHYLECLKLGPEYKRDEGVIKTIQFLYGRSSSESNEGVTRGHRVSMGNGLLGPNDGSCGGKGGRGGSIAGSGGGWLAKSSIVSNEGYGDGGFVVRGGKYSSELNNGGEVNGGGVGLGVFKSLLEEIPGETIRESDGEIIGVDGGDKF